MLRDYLGDAAGAAAAGAAAGAAVAAPAVDGAEVPPAGEVGCAAAAACGWAPGLIQQA